MADKNDTRRREDSASNETGAALNRAVVIIPAKHWSAFKAWIERPAETIPALAELTRLTRAQKGAP
jgi:hypothetical protein